MRACCFEGTLFWAVSRDAPIVNYCVVTQKYPTHRHVFSEQRSEAAGFLRFFWLERDSKAELWGRSGTPYALRRALALCNPLSCICLRICFTLVGFKGNLSAANGNWYWWFGDLTPFVEGTWLPPFFQNARLQTAKREADYRAWKPSARFNRRL